MPTRSRYLPQDDGTAILLDCYDGAYGKTLRIDIQSVESLRALVKLFEGLREGTVGESSLRGLGQAVLVPPLADVRLLRSEVGSIDVTKAGEETLIVWNQPLSGWANAVGLLQPLVECAQARKGAHQYLTQPGQSPLVEVAVME
jgi:hypothetical protein